ncbi:MAG: histidinol dehydrogenase [Candidatus Marinimicrobia bacterium]|nr:histidinol dehydrogenase [Candidatus Neomarinimicrobiota bacterium]
MINWQTLTSEQQERFLMRPNTEDDAKLRTSVEEIIELVKDNGDDALKMLTLRYDGVEIDEFEVSEAEKTSAIKRLEPGVKAAIDRAYEMITSFHAAQVQDDIKIETLPGVNCTLLIRPQQAVGLYVPGGNTPLPSTALMLGVPAKIAGCPKIVLTSPPGSNGQMAPEIIYAASKCGIDSLFKVGGAQAIAALTWGTETIPAVNKIFGPGNRYVTEAKRRVSQIQGKVGIDMPAGPSEVLVIADRTAKPSFVAADLLSQAEHGPDSQVILISPDNSLILAVEAELKIQLKSLSRRKIAEKALSNARFILAKDIDQAIDISNIYAPEHLIINLEKAEQYLDQVVNAGSIFLGPWSPESVGDYASGTNHVLPTYGYARFTDALSLKDFQKRSTVQKLTREGLSSLSDTIMTIAQSEGLDAHTKSISLRLEEAAL